MLDSVPFEASFGVTNNGWQVNTMADTKKSPQAEDKKSRPAEGKKSRPVICG